jgi:hypothetical protein
MRSTHILSSLVLFALLHCSTMSQAQNNMYIHQDGSFCTFSGSKVMIKGSLTNDGLLGGYANSSKGVFYISGSSAQTFRGDSAIQFDSMIINNSSDLNVELELKISKHLNLVDGTINTDRNDSNIYFVHFLDNSSYSNASNASHIDGTARKSGDDQFSFPVGANSNLQLISISAPSQTTDHFAAYYKNVDPSNFGYSTVAIDSNCGGSPVVVDVSEKEYWVLQQTGGSSAVEVTLNYDASSDLSLPANVMVATWDGSAWSSLGNGGNTGSSSNGSVVTGDGCGFAGSAQTTNQFGIFGFCASNLSALPVELLSFAAKKINTSQSLLYWATANELGNSHFEIERSSRDFNFKKIGTVEGANYSTSQIDYQFIDQSPVSGMNYYRLKQVDFDGQFEYSEIRRLDFQNHVSNITVYPNPARDVLNLKNEGMISDENSMTCTLLDQRGSIVQEFQVASDFSEHKIDISFLPRGIYTFKINQLAYRIIIL